jgi:hypothetical protein
MIKKWLLLKTSNPSYADVISLCESEHKGLFPNNELSIRLNNDGTLALVKVCTGEEEFFDTIPEAVLENWHTEETHHLAVDLLNTPEWIADEGDYHGE